ncbi:MAG: GntR family transcriptional regulator, partial [Polyangiaceae bacterium]|nr:GntR family transcriptional regulator [Polyangiaceae bacterium]
MASLTGEVRRVADELVRRIVGGEYPAGLRLPPEVTLAGELGCSRPTLREALGHLSGMGLVESRRGSGVLVRDFRREGTLALLPAYLEVGRLEVPLGSLVRELLRTRALLAEEAARLAATYGRPEGLAEARRLARLLLGLVGDPVAHTRCELDFFRALLVASSMWPTVWFANAFWAPLRALHERLAPIAWYVPPRHEEMLRELLAAIDAQDGVRAATVVREHFQ